MFRRRSWFLFTFPLLTFSCSGSEETDDSASGGGPSSGGSTSGDDDGDGDDTGGAGSGGDMNQLGGAGGESGGMGGLSTGSGGASSTGGAPSTGGTPSSGGMDPGTGGAPSTGGVGPGTGGVGPGTGGTMGGDHLNANGCTFQTADDETGQSTLAMDIWGLPYQQCVIVEVGTTLTWNGSFDVHPLTGGVIPTEDVSSPISAKMGVGDFEYTFDTAGDYPFFCGVHLGAMQGVVYVIDP